MPPLSYSPLLPRAGAVAIVMALAAVAGWSWPRREKPIIVPPRTPLPAVVRFTDGKHTWTLAAEKAGLDPARRHLDLGRAARSLKSIANQAGFPGRSARLVVSDGGIYPTQSLQSRRVVLDDALRRLMTYAASAHPDPVLRLPIVKKDPPVTTAQLVKIDGRIAGFTTRYNPGDRPRTQNVRLVSRRLDGAVVLPGQVFSFNDHVGPREQENGFRVAKVFVKGKMVTDTGGGTCQVSSTLYNAALLAGMSIVERSNHSLTVPYVRPGRDATVYYGQRDFRFRNDSDAPVYIHSVANGGRMTVLFYGSTREVPDVEVTSWSRRRGDRVFAGASRIWKENGRVVRRERLSSDVYKPIELAEQG